MFCYSDFDGIQGKLSTIHSHLWREREREREREGLLLALVESAVDDISHTGHHRSTLAVASFSPHWTTKHTHKYIISLLTHI